MSLQLIAFVLLYLGFLWLAFAKHPRFGLFAYLLAFYAHPPSRWWGDVLPDLRWSLTASLVTMGAVALAARPRVKRNGVSCIRTAPIKLYLLLLGYMIIQFAWALDPALHREAVVLIAKYLILMCLLHQTLESFDHLKAFLVANVLGGFYLGYLAVGRDVSGRLEGIGGPGIDDANTLGMYLGALMFLSASLLFWADKKYRLLGIVALAFIVNGIIYTQSRGAVVAIVLAGGMLWLLVPSRHQRQFFGYACLGVLLVGILGNQYFLDRIGSVLPGSSDRGGGYVAQRDDPDEQSKRSRLAIIRAQIGMIVDNPLGYGSRGTLLNSPQYIPQQYLSYTGSRASHNTFFAYTVDYGLLGGVIFLLMLIAIARQVLDSRRRSNGEMEVTLAFVAAAFCVPCFAGLFTNYLKAEIFFWCAMLLVKFGQLSRLDDHPVRRGKGR